MSAGKTIYFLPLFVFFLSRLVFAGEVFPINAALQAGSHGKTQLVVRVTIAPGKIIYADRFRVEVSAPSKIIPLSIPRPTEEKDEISGENKLVYGQSFAAIYLVEHVAGDALDVKISYQGCDKEICFLPDSREFRLKPDEVSLSSDTPHAGIGSFAENKVAKANSLADIRNKYEVIAVRSGYMGARAFLDFLDASSTGDAVKTGESSLQKLWRSGKIWLSLLLILLGGLALNLTPCVLPLIPVNLAIIGAGLRASSRMDGFRKGAVFGAGMALAYGLLGLLTVLTGAQFGAFNASPWFNIVVAIVFFALGLALFDVFSLDFSGWQSRIHVNGAGLFFVMMLGAISAVLAGACVAPVVIAVLLLATDLYLNGQPAGLILPFCLGLGMALPWPFAGAFTFLPKPGKWMVRVKQAFAVVIMLAALYYAFLGGGLLLERIRSQENITLANSGGEWLSFPAGLAETDPGKPVLIYFWAGWCKSCKAMTHQTFRNAGVARKMKDFVCLKFQAENPEDETTRTVLREFGVLGLPSYVVLKRKDRSR